MSVNFEIKRKITVDGKEYGSLAEVPPEVRTAILEAMASGATSSRTAFHINGKTYSAKTIALAIGVAALLYWLLR